MIIKLNTSTYLKLVYHAIRRDQLRWLRYTTSNMNIQSITVEIPVTVSIASTDANTTCLEILIDDDASDDLCEKAAEVLYSRGISTDHPIVWMCDDNEKLYLDVANSMLDLRTRISLSEEHTIRCNMHFNLRCNIPHGDDVAIDKILPVAVTSVIHTTR